MKNMKKTLLVSLSLVLVAALAVGLTLAYLQDDDSDVNVMTLGNVKIEQHEYERVVNADGTYATKTIDDVTSYVLQDFTQGKALLPIVGDPSEPGNSAAYAGYDDTIVRMTQVDSYGGMQVFAGKNAQDKFVVVENTGKTDAYVRTLVAIEVGTTEDNGALVKSSYHFTWKENYIGTFTLDGNEFKLYEYVYSGWTDGGRHVNGVLTAGDTAYPSLSQVYLKHNATNEYCAALDGNGNGTLDILVLSQAVQAAGFENAQTALDTAFGKSSEKAAEWFGGVAAKNSVLIDEPFAQSMDATEAYTIDGNGKTVVGVATSIDAFQWSEDGKIPAMSTVFSSEGKTGAKATVNDITFTGTMSAVMAGQYIDSSSNWFNTEFNNVKIIDAEVVSFSAGIAPALCVYGNMTMNNCVVTGTTLSALDTDGYTVYDVAVVNYSNTVINDSKIGSLYMWNQAKVTVADGTEIDTIVIRGNMNATKYGLVVEAGAVVGSIDLSNITNTARVNITIEEGATVGAFVDNGVEYATLDAWKAAQ